MQERPLKERIARAWRKCKQCALIIIGLSGFAIGLLGAFGMTYGVGKLLEDAPTFWRYAGMAATALVSIPTFQMAAFLVYFVSFMAEHRLSMEDEDYYG